MPDADEREPMIMTGRCECEHVDHFEGELGSCHAYGAEIDLEHMTTIQTPYGDTAVCVDCRRTHLTDDVLR